MKYFVLVGLVLLNGITAWSAPQGPRDWPYEDSIARDAVSPSKAQLMLIADSLPVYSSPIKCDDVGLSATLREMKLKPQTLLTLSAELKLNEIDASCFKSAVDLMPANEGN